MREVVRIDTDPQWHPAVDPEVVFDTANEGPLCLWCRFPLVEGFGCEHTVWDDEHAVTLRLHGPCCPVCVLMRRAS